VVNDTVGLVWWPPGNIEAGFSFCCPAETMNLFWRLTFGPEKNNNMNSNALKMVSTSF
jgi:hypothetical protein